MFKNELSSKERELFFLFLKKTRSCHSISKAVYGDTAKEGAVGRDVGWGSSPQALIPGTDTAWETTENRDPQPKATLKG